tara:strand:- start:5 stop:409 length:405 start_codon:yes stop_codon:yes gene_type:complete
MGIYITEERDKDIDINILPMIDVIFAILTFFIISSLSLIKLETIPVNLPKASSSVLNNSKLININIDKYNNIFINKQPTNLSELTPMISSLINLYSSKIVVLSADKDVSYGSVVEVLDKLRLIDNLRIGISTQR